MKVSDWVTCHCCVAKSRNWRGFAWNVILVIPVEMLKARCIEFYLFIGWYLHREEGRPTAWASLFSIQLCPSQASVDIQAHNLKRVVDNIYYCYYISSCDYSHQFEQMVFLMGRGMSDSKSLQISWTLLGILADFVTAVVCQTSLFSMPLGTFQVLQLQ